jgi:predicted metal-dependent phosphoesterase TrpH
MKIDLHMHSTASDGRLTPAALVHLAHERGLTTIALTDHDTTDGVVEAQAAGQTLGVEVIAWVEINTESDDGDVHFLGYFVNPDDATFQAHLATLRNARRGRARLMVDKLAELGLTLDWTRVQEIAGDGAVGRPHVARALLEHGYIATLGEAFDKYIGNDGPAYVPRYRLTPEEAIAAIRAAGGVASLAHPAVAGTVPLVPRLAGAGLGALEVYYSEHTLEDQEMLLALAHEYGLVPTGGSDFHALDDPTHATLGSVWVPPETVEQLRQIRADAGPLAGSGG